jgi:uncharacterized cupin superfamily protein
MKIRIEEVKEETFESPKKRFSAIGRQISAAFQEQDDKDRKPPFDLEHAVLPAGKRNYPYHSHATAWEMYYAISGSAQMRLNGKVLDFQAGEVMMCPPGCAHQLINNGKENFEYLVIANNTDFDSCYYPDSDKLYLNPVWQATPEHVDRGWTRVKEGLVDSYWDGEE